MNRTHEQPTDEWVRWAAETEDGGSIAVGGAMCRLVAIERNEILPELAAVGQLLDIRRREQGISSDDLVRRSRVAKESLVDLERGLKMPNSADIIHLVAHVLNLPGDKLVEAAGILGTNNAMLSDAALRCANRAKPATQLWPSEREALTEFIGILSGG